MSHHCTRNTMLPDSSDSGNASNADNSAPKFNRNDGGGSDDELMFIMK